MKNLLKFTSLSFLTFCLFATLMGCKNKSPFVQQGILQVDVTKKYPVKELNLEDLADIEYVLLDMDDDFLFNASPRLITDDYFIMTNFQNGDFLIFDRQGKPVSKFNRKGNGAGEYTYLFGNVLYDSDADELYISTSGKIQVYSIRGEYKRSLNIMNNAIVTQMMDFDEECLICFENYTLPTPFSLISKKDGSLVESIPVRAEEKISIYVQRHEGEMVYTQTGPNQNLIADKDHYLLTDHSLDTVYRYGKERIIEPVMVRTPSVQTMDPVVYLNSYVETSHYLFFQCITVQWDWELRQGFQQKNLFADKKDGQIYEQRIVWKDCTGYNLEITPYCLIQTQNSKLGFIYLNPRQLQDALEDGRLSGRLHELVSSLEEDDNDIFMLLHFK